jgi:hypothetical protein
LLGEELGAGTEGIEREDREEQVLVKIIEERS